jgi:citronellol/citronellal dehydrogenase
MSEGPTNCFAPDLLAGKRALVTGGGTGLGRAIAFALARCGADLLLAARRIEALEATKKQIEDETGRDVAVSTVNIRDLESVAALSQEVAERWGQVDILVNNAGGQFPQKARDFSPKGWRSIIDLNLNGSWNMTQAFGCQMLDSGAARAAITELARSLAYEWGPKVRINCLGPGAVETVGFDETYDDDVLGGIAETPIPHPGTAEDIANGVVFLVSPAGRFVTGEFLHVDGGTTLNGPNQALKPRDFPERTGVGPDW